MQVWSFFLQLKHCFFFLSKERRKCTCNYIFFTRAQWWKMVGKCPIVFAKILLTCYFKTILGIIRIRYTYIKLIFSLKNDSGNSNYKFKIQIIHGNYSTWTELNFKFKYPKSIDRKSIILCKMKALLLSC